MFIPFKPHPGPWQLYTKRLDNQGLDVMKVKEKYLREQYEHESYINYINWLNFQPKGPAPGTSVTSSGAFSSGYWDDNGIWIDGENWID